MRLLSAEVSLAADADDRDGARYGRIDDVEKFTNDVVTKYYRGLPGGHGYLTEQDRSELLAQLFVEAIKCAEKYDPTKGIGFRTYVFRTCWNRITDWLRKRGGDRRYTPRPVEESLDASHELVGDGSASTIATLDDLQSIDTTGLTPQSVMTLERIVRPMIQEGLTKDELETVLGRDRREINRLMAQLRQELELRNPELASRRAYYKRRRERELAARKQHISRKELVA